MKPWLALGLAALTACSDALEQDTTAGQVVAVLNSGAGTVSCVDATDLKLACTAGLAPLGSVPSGFDARGSVLLVPFVDADGVRVIDLMGAGRTVALARNSAPTGVAIENDSIAWVANAGRNTVTRFNYRTGDTLGSAAVGIAPQGVVVTSRTIFVLNGNLAGGAPAGPSWLTPIPRFGPSPLQPDSVGLTGTNARFAALGGDGFVYVVNSGAPGKANGKVSIVDPLARSEVAVVNGLGESPGPAVYHPSGRLLVASRSEGILEVNTLTRAVARGPGNGVKPAGDGISALAVDPRGRIYAVAPKDCTTSGVVHVLSAPPAYRELKTVTVGVCPSSAALAFLPPVP